MKDKILVITKYTDAAGILVALVVVLIIFTGLIDPLLKWSPYFVVGTVLMCLVAAFKVKSAWQYKIHFLFPSFFVTCALVIEYSEIYVKT